MRRTNRQKAIVLNGFEVNRFAAQSDASAFGQAMCAHTTRLAVLGEESTRQTFLQGCRNPREHKALVDVRRGPGGIRLGCIQTGCIQTGCIQIWLYSPAARCRIQSPIARPLRSGVAKHRRLLRLLAAQSSRLIFPHAWTRFRSGAFTPWSS
jgi:hypothetical protein